MSITTDNQTYYYHRDHQGSIISLTDDTQNMVESFNYTAYGATTKTQTSFTNNPYAYTGREYDDKDLYYYRARYYDPTISRFLSEDPIGFAGGDFNLYRYVLNDPVNLVDPDGLTWYYSQSSGQITQSIHGQTQQGQGGTGYAGIGTGLNNPNAQNRANVGPLPQGTYTIEPQTNSPNTGQGILPLTPDPNNTMYGRHSFQFHGDNRAMNNTASNGCIVSDRNTRNQIANSFDNLLIVVP